MEDGKEKQFSPLGLAYIGDAVYEIIVRTMVLSKGNAPVNKLHKQSKEYVNAKAQAELYHQIAAYLTEEEQAIFRRLLKIWKLEIIVMQQVWKPYLAIYI